MHFLASLFFGKPKCGQPTIVKLAILAGLLFSSLTGCAAINAVSTGKPLDPVQVQADLATFKQLAQEGSCAVALAAEVAAPIVAVASDAQGGKVLNAVGQGGNVICSVSAPTVVSPPGTVLGAVPTS